MLSWRTLEFWRLWCAVTLFLLMLLSTPLCDFDRPMTEAEESIELCREQLSGYPAVKYCGERHGHGRR